MTNYYNYYLIALNIEEGKVKPRIINIDQDMLGEKDKKELTNLAFIDNLTSNYKEGDFRRYLFDKGVLKDLYTPVFVVRLSKSYKKDVNGNTLKKTSIKYYSPIFQSNDSELINNLALTTIRQRSLTISDASYLLQYFESLYYNNEEYRDIVRYTINEHDINHLLNYKEYIKNKKSNPIKYSLLREVVSTLYEFEKCSTFEKYMSDVYGREDSTRDIIKVMPEEISVKKSDLKPMSNETIEEIYNKRYENWDNPKAKEQYEKGLFKDRELLTLTLEDRLRAHMISIDEFASIREQTEAKFRK